MSENTVYIGRKPVMQYVMAIMTALQRGPTVVRARGRSISIAVDAVEVVRHKFKSLVINGIEIGTDVLGEPGDLRNVSTIGIKVARPE